MEGFYGYNNCENTPDAITTPCIVEARIEKAGGWYNLYQTYIGYQKATNGDYIPIQYVRYGYSQGAVNWIWNAWRKISNNPIKIKVCNYNVGKWNDGVTRPSTSEVDNISVNYHRFLGTFDADILFMEESFIKIDESNTVDAYEKMLKFKYPYKWRKSNTSDSGVDGQLVIYSKYPIKNAEIHTFTSASQRPYITAEIMVNGELINVILTHFDISTDSTNRMADYAELKALMSTYKTGIVCGDFNAYTLNEFDTMSEYNMANHGSFGDFETWGVGITTDWNKCIDNIFTTKNISIQNVVVGTNYNLSDHKPIMAELIIS